MAGSEFTHARSGIALSNGSMKSANDVYGPNKFGGCPECYAPLSLCEYMFNHSPSLCISYRCRKNLADRRIRVKGRFVKLAPGQTEEEYLEQEFGESTVPAVKTSTTRRKGQLAASLADVNDAQTDGSSDGSFTSTSSAKRTKKSQNAGSGLPPRPPRSLTRQAAQNKSVEDTEDGPNGTPTSAADVSAEDMDVMPYKRMRRHSVAY